MRDEFDWRMGDDLPERKSEEQEPGRPPQSSRKKWGRWVWGITAVLLLACLAGTIAYSQLNRRAAAVTNQLSEDVIAVHQLVLKTAVSRDTDLFQTFLNNPANEWGGYQLELIARDLYLNRAPLGLWVDSRQLISQTLTMTNTTTYFSPDLQRVEVQVEQPYLTHTSDDVIEPIVLVNTAVYQKKNPSWLLVAPDNTFWGNMLEAKSSIITVHYPARDAQTAERLSADLNNLLVTACESDIFPCPTAFSLDLYLETEASSLLGLNRRFQLASGYSSKFGRRYSLMLPTPTLVGLPVDDAGYQALYRGYGAQLLGALIVNLHPNFRQEPPDRKFLVRQLAQMELPMPEPVGYHPAETAVPPPIPLPDQDIVVLCRSDDEFLMHYDLQTDKWQPLFVDGFVYGLTTMGNKDGALLTIMTGTGGQIRWWQPDRQRILVEQAQNVYVSSAFLFTNEETDKHIINFYTGPEGVPSWKLLDENNCTADSCELVDISDWPMVSPNGRYRLMISLVEDVWTHHITLEDMATDSQTPHGLGFSPVWLDDQTFAFVRVDNSDFNNYPSQSTLLIINAAQTSGPITEITMDDISASINNAVSLNDLMIGGLMPGVDGNWLLLLFATDPAQLSLAYLFEYFPETGKISFFQSFREFQTAVFLGSSPDNRYFSIAVLEESGVAMRLYDVQQNQYRSYSVPSAWRGGYDWTPDSEWLLILEEDGVRLVAPAYDYERRIVHDFSGCETAVWVNSP